MKVSRKGIVTVAAGVAAAAPFFNVGRYRLFASNVFEYGDRAITLANDSLVIDRLSLFNPERPLRLPEDASNAYDFRRAPGEIWLA